MDRILVFPAGMPRAIEFARRATDEGRRVIGCSSLPHDPARSHYEDWAFLPFVTDDAFHPALAALVSKERVTGIYTPNPVVWQHLNDTIAARHPGLTLLGGPPVDREMAPYRTAFAFGAETAAAPLPLPGLAVGPSRFSAADLAATFRHVEALPGMCDHEKIRALFAVFASVPSGDVVEIGSWWGKSALLLHRLASLAGTGPLLCIDPWTQENLRQGDAKGLVDGTEVSTDEAFEVFCANLSPYADGRMNYLRMPADDAAPLYQPGLVVETPSFGRTVYNGGIALLHVDGNHAYAHASADVRLWAPHLLPGGWLVVDDYQWPYGDGPRRAGDEYLERMQGAYDCAFVMGSALFVRLNAAE